MNLLFFGSYADSTHNETGESPEHIEHDVHPHDDSLDEGDEYVDDALRMHEQPFKLD